MKKARKVLRIEASAPLPLSVRTGSLTGRRLHLILMPTEACNFRCVYCYEWFQYKRMEPAVVQGVKRLLGRRFAELDVLELSWFGGEPLLARDIVEEILEHVQNLSMVRPSLRLASDMTTNAYLLTRPVFRKLLGLGVASYQISFDGPREHHDRKRVLAGGKGTFDRIWGNTAALREEPGEFRVLVRVHADKENQHALREFVDQYKETFGGDRRFQLFVRPLSRLGGPNDHALATFDRDDSRPLTEALRRYASDQGIRQGPDKPSIPVCYAAMGDSLLVRANGRLNKCTVALEHPNNQVGRLHPDGTVETDRPKLLPWMRGLVSGNPSELACPMMGLADPVSGSAPREDVPLSLGAAPGRV